MSLLATIGGGEPTATQTKNQTKVNLTLAPKKHLQLIKIEWRDLWPFAATSATGQQWGNCFISLYEKNYGKTS